MNPIERHEQLAQMGAGMLAVIAEMPASRELSMVKTKIDEALQWNKSDKAIKFPASEVEPEA